MDQLQRTLGWSPRSGLVAQSKRHDFVEYMRTKTFAQDPADGELKANYAAKRARIGARQGLLLDYLTNKMKGRSYLLMEDLADKVAGSGNELYYRLEQLRLLGFVKKLDLSDPGGEPSFGWSLSDKFLRDIGR